MVWTVYTFVLDCNEYPNEYTVNELNSIVQTATQDIKKDYKDQEALWKADGNLEARYTLDGLVHKSLPLHQIPTQKLKHDNIISYDNEPNVHERLIITHWDDTLTYFTVMVVMSNTVSLISDKTELV